MTILYTFRRCPYAMRARMALAASGLPVRVREIILRDKPAEMLAASPKGTVPVLVRTDGTILDESLDIMHWALAQHDPERWLSADPAETAQLIAENDGPFKHALDRYKYPDRHPGSPHSAPDFRSAGMQFLHDLAARIEAHAGQLCGPAPTLADIAIFPFVRQFAGTDEAFWTAHAPARLQTWLTGHVTSARFGRVMTKFPRWQTGRAEPLLIAP